MYIKRIKKDRCDRIEIPVAFYHEKLKCGMLVICLVVQVSCAYISIMLNIRAPLRRILYNLCLQKSKS